MNNLELATTDPSAQAFIDSLAVMAYPFAFDEDYDAMGSHQALFRAAEPFLQEHKLATKWNRIVRRASPSMEEVEDDLADFAANFRDQGFVRDQRLTARDLDFLRAFRVFLQTDSESSQRALMRFVGQAASPKIAQLYADESNIDVKSQGNAVAKAARLVERITGRKGNKLTVDEAKAARESKPALYKQYLDARKPINEVTKSAILDITRANGGPMLVSELIRRLNQRGVEHSLPEGFSGKHDERGWYTLFDEQIDGAPVGEVRMNPTYTRGSQVYVFQNRAPGAKNWQTIYTKGARQARKDDKYQRVATTYDSLDRHQRVWRGDMLGSDEDRQELGVIAELLYLTASRIGSAGNVTDGKATYGLSTITTDHVTFKGNQMRIKYSGKKGALIEHLITGNERYSRRVVELMKTYVAQAGRGERIFENTAREINQYIKGRVGMPISAHGFRYVRGTRLMIDELARQRQRLGKQPTERQIADAFKQASESVGDLLGHTTKSADGHKKIVGSTAVKSYIDPAVSRSWFEEFGVRAPRNVESL